jgi:hypothetical protein
MQGIQIQHYTKLLADLIEQKRLRFKKKGKRGRSYFRIPVTLENTTISMMRIGRFYDRFRGWNWWNFPEQEWTASSVGVEAVVCGVISNRNEEGLRRSEFRKPSEKEPTS